MHISAIVGEFSGKNDSHFGIDLHTPNNNRKMPGLKRMGSQDHKHSKVNKDAVQSSFACSQTIQSAAVIQFNL